MNRLKVNINGTDYDLPTAQFMDPDSIDLSNWDDEIVGSMIMYFNAPVSTDDIIDPVGLSISYGDFIISLENGMHITMQFVREYDVYTDYLTVRGLYNADSTPFGNLKGLDGGGYDPYIFGIYYKDHNETEYYGICIGSESGPQMGYCQIFLFNPAIWDGNVIDPYTGQPLPPVQGGWGSWDRSTDQIGANPTPSAVVPFNSGVNMYVLDSAALQSFSGFLWGSDESIFAALWSRYTNYVYNPIGAIIACHSLPTEFTPAGTSRSAISLAGTALFPISGTLKSSSTQFIDQSYTLNIAEFYGDFMDYTSTRIVLHLPFCGVAVIDPVYCVGGGLTVLYRCDVCTGNVTAFIIGSNRFGHSELIQCAGGNAAYTVALTGHSDGMMEALGSAAKTITGAAATAMTGVPVSTGGSTDIIGQKESTTIIGNMSGSSAITSSLDLYAELIYTEPSNPEGYTSLRGRPSDIGATVGSFQGFTVFSDVHADGVYRATDDEKRMIEQMLKAGVII